jgi:hypothetical protein
MQPPRGNLNLMRQRLGERRVCVRERKRGEKGVNRWER